MNGITYTTYEKVSIDFENHIRFIISKSPNDDFDSYCKRVDKREEKIRRKNEKRTTNRFIAHLSGQYPDAEDKRLLALKYVPKLSPYQRRCRYRTRNVKR